MRLRLLTAAAVACAVVLATPIASQATTLEEAVQGAIVFHPTIQRDEALEQASEQQIEEAYSGYLPSLDADLAVGAEATNSPVTRAGGFGTRGLINTENRLTARQLIFDGWLTPGLVGAARANHRAALGDLRETSELIGIEAAQLYLNVLRDTEFVDAAEANVASHQEISDRIVGLAQAGRGSEADIAQAESRLALAKASLEDLRGGLREVIAQYIETVGVTPEDLERPTVPDYGEPATVDEAIAIAMEQNPSVSAASARVDQAEEQIRVAEAAYYPRLDVEAFGSINQNLDGTRGGDSDLNGRARMQWNLFNGFGDVARTRRAERLHNAAEGTLGDESRRIREETRTVWESLQTARDRIGPIREHHAAQQRVLNAYLQQFDVGRRSLLDLLDAQNEYFQAQLQLSDADFNVTVAEYELIFVTGRFLSTLGIVVPSDEDDHLEPWENQ